MWDAAQARRRLINALVSRLALRLTPIVALLACRADPGVVATLDPTITTVIHVTWTTADPTTDQVQFGVDPTYGTVTPLEATPTTTHSATLYGIPPETVCHFAVQSGATTSADQTITTGRLPNGVPSFVTDTPVTDPNVGPFLLTSTVNLPADKSTVVILDLTGAPVWYGQAGAGVTSVRLRSDGGGVYFVTNSIDDRGANAIVSMDFDGTTTSVSVPEAHHDVIEGPDGGWVTFQTVYQVINGVNVAGDDLVEVAADGTTRVVWDAFQNLDVVENAGWNESQIAGAADWTHANGLVYDPSDDSYVISLYFTEQVIKIDRATGAMDWILGGTDSNFTFATGEEFGPQHAPELTPDGIRLFDNRSFTYGSRMTEYALDQTAGTASLTWSWQFPDNAWTPVLGDVHRFPDGSALGAWGLAGRIVALGPDDTIDGELVVGDSLTVGQVSMVPTFYPGG